MIKQITYTLVLVLLFTFGNTMAQEAKLSKADKNFDNLSYIKSVDIYLKVAEKGYKSQELFQNLGDSYYFNSNYTDAAKWYDKLFNYTDDVDPEYLLRYSQSLKSVGNQEESMRYYNLFLETFPDSEHKLTAQDYLDKIEANSNRYDFETTSLNTNGVDFGGTIVNEKYFVFSSTRDTGTVFKRRHSWNNLPFMDLYQAEIKADNTFGEAVKLKGDVNTKYHETTATFTNDGKTMYFTRNNSTNTSKKDIQRLKIYRATLVDGEWENIEDLTINSNDFSTAHPILSTDNKTLYYVSNNPESLGATDIFKVDILEDNTLGTPVNLGNKINTAGRESFPYLTKDNALYFSSDGHFGLGGYDVFYVNLDKENEAPINLGTPINSAFDDVAYIINSETKKGYLSSNREGGMGYDDIYSFTENTPIDIFEVEVEITGVVTDKITSKPLPNSTISILDVDNTLVTTATTNNKGEYTVTVKGEKTHLVRAEQPKYNTQEVVVEVKDVPYKQDFALIINEQDIDLGTDLGPLLAIENIYFDLSKSNIRPDAAIELQKVVELLNTYPKIKIDIRAHTDSRGSDSYNLKLSDRRAQSTRQYIVDNGIEASRVTAKGYGETRLVNSCKNGVKCSEEEHQDNRRSEFIIVEK